MQPIHRLLLIGLASCTAAAPTDGANDSFASGGKADAVIAEGSPEAEGVLSVVNSLSQDELDDGVRLDARAAAGIVAHRLGPDTLDDTSDDDPFETLAELDAVPYVGPVALDHLLTYAYDHGYIGGGREYEAVFSIAANDAWAVGKNGIVDHFDGSTWTALDSGTSAWLTAVWASGPDDVWISGYAGAVLHWDGSTLTKVDDWHLLINLALVDIDGSGPDNVWFVGGTGEWGKTILRWDGTKFDSVPCNGCQAQPSAVHVVSETDVWLGGLQETVYHYDGTGFEDVGIYLTTYPSGVGKIWAAPSGTAFAEVDGDIYTRPASGTWSLMYSVPAHDVNESWLDLRSFIAFAEDDIWASGGEGHIAHWDGTAWELTHVAGMRDYYDIGGTSSHDLWAVGPGGRAHFDGTTWTESFPAP